MELFEDNGELVSKEEWEKIIDDIRKEVKVNENYKELKEELKENIIKAIKKRIPNERFGIFFSGGVDSTTIAFICRSLSKNFTCYNVGFKDGGMQEAPDVVEAKRVAKKLELPLITKTYNMNEAEEILKKVTDILGKPEKINADYIVKVGVGSVLIAASRLANEKIFFSGLGSEEIFAGYQRHAKSKNIQEECWFGLKKMWERDILRDHTIAKNLKIKLCTPFLDKDVIISGMKISAGHKIKGGKNKIVLREIAEELGLAKEFAWRKKQGAQYGSKFDRALEKLAKKYNERYKKDYLLQILK